MNIVHRRHHLEKKRMRRKAKRLRIKKYGYPHIRIRGSSGGSGDVGILAAILNAIFMSKLSRAREKIAEHRH